MKPKLLLRIAAVVMLLHNAGHIVGALTWKTAEDTERQAVIDQMLQNKAPFMGAMRSMGEYYDGYGILSALAMLFIAAILWFTAAAKAEEVVIARKIMLIAAIILFFWAVVELIFFFPFAASFSFIASVLTIIAYTKMSKL